MNQNNQKTRYFEDKYSILNCVDWGRTSDSAVTLPLQFSLPVFTVRGLDYPIISGRCCPSSLYTFPLLGLARDCHQHYLLRVPRIWAIFIHQSLGDAANLQSHALPTELLRIIQ